MISPEKKITFELGNHEDFPGYNTGLPKDIDRHINITCLEVAYNKIVTIGMTQPNEMLTDILAYHPYF